MSPTIDRANCQTPGYTVEHKGKKYVQTGKGWQRQEQRKGPPVTVSGWLELLGDPAKFEAFMRELDQVVEEAKAWAARNGIKIKPAKPVQPARPVTTLQSLKDRVVEDLIQREIIAEVLAKWRG